MPTINRKVVVKVEGGYQVHDASTTGALKPTNTKVYFHPTSAYAAMGRIVHTENVKALKLPTDPAKAPAKEAAAK
jgi:hypothetical protein